VSWKKNDNSFHGYQHETREHMPIVQYLDRQTHLSPRSIIRSIFISYHRYGNYFDYTSCQQKFYTCYQHQHHHHYCISYLRCLHPLKYALLRYILSGTKHDNFIVTISIFLFLKIIIGNSNSKVVRLKLNLFIH